VEEREAPSRAVNAELRQEVAELNRLVNPLSAKCMEGEIKTRSVLACRGKQSATPLSFTAKGSAGSPLAWGPST